MKFEVEVTKQKSKIYFMSETIGYFVLDNGNKGEIRTILNGDIVVKVKDTEFVLKPIDLVTALEPELNKV